MFIFNRLLTEEEQKKLVQQADCESEVVIFYAEDRENGMIDYSGVFSLDAELVRGISFSEKWISKSGPLNKQFIESDVQLFEFLCRLIKEIGSGKLIYMVPSLGSSAEEGAKAAEPAYVYAYIIRLHMQYLHKLKLMDAVFVNVCALMQQKGCFTQFQQYMNHFLANQEEFERIAGYTAPFLILRGDDTCGGVLQQFADDLAEALIENGQAVVEIRGDGFDYEKIQGMLAKGIVGFQTRALEIDFFQNIHGPKFQFWFDNPLRFTGVLRNLPDDHYVLCQDADHAELIRRYYHTPNAIQFPPGGIEMPLQEGARPYDVVFVGNFFPDNGDDLSEEQKAFYEYMICHPRLTFEQGFQEMAGEETVRKNMAGERLMGEESAGQQDDEYLIQQMLELKPACRAVIGHFRNKVITTILDAGINLHVYGDSWKDAPFRDHENLTLHPQISMKDSMGEFQKAKIGLNIMSWYKSGMTERVANIMLAGTVCLSDETAYLREHIEDGKEIVLYRLDDLDKLSEKIQQLLDNLAEREEIARNGYQKAVCEFSWNARAVQLIELAESTLRK